MKHDNVVRLLFVFCYIWQIRRVIYRHHSLGSLPIMTVRMPDLLAQFCSQFWQAHVNRDADTLVALCPVSPNHRTFVALRSCMKGLPNGFPSSRDLAQILPQASGEDTLLLFLADMLRHVRSIKDPNQARSLEELQHVTAAASKSFATVYGYANRTYRANSDTGHLNPLVVVLARQLISLSIETSRVTRDAKLSTVEAAAALIEKTFRDCAASDNNGNTLSSPQSRRGDGIWALGSVLCRLYLDRIKNVVRADAIYAAFLNLRPSESEHIAQRAPFISLQDVVSTWYYRGKLQLSSGRLALATEFLNMAWEQCPRSAEKNLRAILVLLIPCNILTGRFPSPALLRMFNIEKYFLPLIHAIKTGNRALWVSTIEQHTEWYRARGIWLILRERGEVLVLRTLFRRALAMFRQEHPGDRLASAAHAPTWIFLTAARVAFGVDEDVGEIEAEDVVCLLASLIDQGYIAGRLSYQQTLLSLSKQAGTIPGFPAVVDVRGR